MTEVKSGLLFLWLCVVSSGPLQPPSWGYFGDDLTPCFFTLKMLPVFQNGLVVLCSRCSFLQLFLERALRQLREMEIAVNWFKSWIYLKQLCDF